MPEPEVRPTTLHVGADEMVAALELMARTAGEAITVTDRDARVLIWNPAAERHFNLPASLAVGRSIYDLTETTVMPGSDERDPREAALAEGSWRGRRIERARIGPNVGREIIIEVTLSRLDTADGELVGVMSVRRDITAAVRMEGELAALGRLVTTTGVARTRGELADGAIDILCAATGAAHGAITRHEGDVMLVDAVRGLTPDAVNVIRRGGVASSPLARAIAPPGTVLMAGIDDLPLRPETREALEASAVASMAAVGLHADGELTGMLVLGWNAGAAGSRPSDATLLLAAAHVERALENLRLVEVLMASEQRYRTLFDESPEALLLLATDGTIVDANGAARRVFRADMTWLIGRSAVAITGARPSDLHGGRASDAPRGHPAVRTSGTAADGTSLPVELQVAPVFIDGTSRLLLLVRDLTAEVQLQAELIQAQKMDALGQLVSGVAHELNNPLSAIIAFSQLIRRDPSLPEELRRDADTLNSEADRTRRIVQNLLDFARQRPPERHPTRIETLVRTVLELQAYNLSTGRIAVDVDIPSSLPSVPIDRSQLQQVLLNLTRNAMQAIASVRNKGRIAIVARAVEGGPPGAPVGPMVRLAITDDGPGVAKDHRERLFLPFFSTKPPGEGTGLGLPVSFGIVAAHGGNLRFEPGPGGVGATFIVELPIAPSTSPAGSSQPAPSDPDAWPVIDATETAEAVTPARSTPTAPASAPRHGGREGEPGEPPTILVLDDEPSIRRLLTKVLAAAGFRPVIAATGPEAVAAVDAGGIDVVVCDHRMAGMSGIDVYEAVVALDPALADRFVFMSGDVLNPELRSFSRRHRLDLLAKPFDVEAVVHAVRTLVEARPRD